MRLRSYDPVLVLATILLLGVGALGLRAAVSQVGETFPGFLVLGNRVVASVGLSLWPGTAHGAIFQHQVVAMDGVPVRDVGQLHQRVRSLPPGTPVLWSLRSGDEVILRRVRTREFGWQDFALLHALYLANGLALAVGALVALHRRRNPAARACAPLLTTGALWVLSAPDLYGPYLLFRLHALCEAILFPAALVMALGFPHPARCLARWPWLPRAIYAAALALAVTVQAGLHRPDAYVVAHLLAVTAFGLALIVLVVSEFDRLRRPLEAGTSVRLGVVALGTLVAFGLPIVLTAAESLTGGRSPQNALALTGLVFPLAVSYALLRGGMDSAARSTVAVEA